MSNLSPRPDSEADLPFPPTVAQRRPWTPPRLIDHGDVRELTLGTSAGLPESGAPGTFRA